MICMIVNTQIETLVPVPSSCPACLDFDADVPDEKVLTYVRPYVRIPYFSYGDS